MIDRFLDWWTMHWNRMTFGTQLLTLFWIVCVAISVIGFVLTVYRGEN